MSGEPLLHHYFVTGPHWRSVYLIVVVGRVVHYKNALRGGGGGGGGGRLGMTLLSHFSIIW